MLIRLELDQMTALHLTIALRRWRVYCEQRDYYRPPALVELARLAEIAKTGRTTEHDIPAGGRFNGLDAEPFLTQRAFAEATGRSVRTVQRWIQRGQLTTTLAGIPREELDRLRRGSLNGRRRDRTVDR